MYGKAKHVVKSSLFILSFVNLCLGWTLPPVQFLSEFVKGNDRTQISISVPFGIPSMNMYFRQLTRENEIPASFKFSGEDVVENRTTLKNPQDLIVFIPDESDIDSHIEKFIGWFNHRKRNNKEYWLLDITSLNTKARSRLDNLKLDLDDDLFWFAYSNKGIELFEVYRIHDDFGITVKPFGSWSADNGLTSPMYGKWIRRKNMQGAKLKVVTELQKPYITEMIPTGSPGEFEMKGMYAEVFFALQYILNFTFTVTKPPDGQWGGLQSDGTWTGMIRELQDERADIATTSFAVSVARSQVVTFSETITESYSALFIKNPSGTFNFKAYVDPLKYMSWIFVGLFCIIAPTSLFATSRLGHEPMKSEFTWGKSQIFVLSALTLRGWSVSPHQTSSRCAFIVIMLAGVVIYYYWEAMLVSYLSTRFIVLPFTNIRELMENSDYRIGVIRGTSHEAYFKSSADPIVQKAYSERIEPYLEEYFPFSADMEALLLKDESLAVYQNFFMGSYFPGYRTCGVIAIPAKYDSKYCSYGYQKHSPYQGLFDHYIKEMREKGALKQILNKYETGTQICPDESGKPLGFESCFTAFLALISGMGIGFLFFFLEIMNKFLNKFGNSKSPIIEAYNHRFQ